MVVALLFYRRETARAGVFGIYAVTLLKLALMAIDFRTRMNQHYMLLGVTAAFLLVRDKALFCRILIVLFYFWAGLLKFNRDWLSGAALYGPLWLLPPSALPWATRYAIVLELVVPWALLPRRPAWLFWAAWAQLVVFHVLSSPVVGFFYPLVMLGFLLWMAAARWDAPLPRTRSPEGIALVALFCAAQLIPRLLSPDPALTGEGRMFALHMFDGRIVCRSTLTATLPDGRRASWHPVGVADTRTACDPILFWNHARNACRERPDARFDLEVWARHITDPEGAERRLIDLPDFCRLNPDYRWLHHNPWILPPGSPFSAEVR